MDVGIVGGGGREGEEGETLFTGRLIQFNSFVQLLMKSFVNPLCSFYLHEMIFSKHLHFSVPHLRITHIIV